MGKLVSEVEKCDDNNDNNVKEAGSDNDNNVKDEKPMRAVNLVFGEDVRFARMPANCSVSQLRDIVRTRFPSLKSVLIKYKYKEGDLVTINTSEEIRWDEESADPNGSVRLFIAEVDPEHEPWFEEGREGSETQGSEKNLSCSESAGMRHEEENGTSSYIDSWIIQFAQLLENHVGFNSDACLGLHELEMKLYTEAMEDAFASEEAHEIFGTAEEKFQEMAALLFKPLG